jgi:hypothetical protein
MEETQVRAIARLLADNPEGITALDALREARCMRLAARIADLKAQGWDISSEMVTVESGKRIARYRLVGPMTLWGQP